MSKITEKLEIAKELGLLSIVKNLEMEQERKILTELKLKPTTDQEIREKLGRGNRVMDFKWHYQYQGAEIFMMPFMGVLSGIAIGLIMGLILVKGFQCNPLKVLPFVGLTVGAWVAFVCRVTWSSELNVRACSLSLWSDPIPYGALLAVKEAKSRGLTSFTVWFPSLRESRQRELDPIITGEKNGVLVEVFAWDDGKIYE